MTSLNPCRTSKSKPSVSILIISTLLRLNSFTKSSPGRARTVNEPVFLPFVFFGKGLDPLLIDIE